MVGLHRQDVEKRKKQAKPFITAFNVDIDPVRSAWKTFPRGPVMEHESVDQVAGGQLSGGGPTMGH